MERLTSRGRAARVIATVIAGGLLLAGTIWGDDDHFPFGPFRMYASAVDPDAPTIDTRLEAVDTNGNTVLLTERNSGIRRAEIEGQLTRFRAEPELLSVAADAYHERNPHAPSIAEIRIVIEWHEVSQFQPTGESHEEVVASWAP